MSPIRRLPVLQNAGTSDEERPAWQWILIGVAFIFSIWIPIAMLGNWVAEGAVRRTLGNVPPAEIAERVASANASTRFGLWLAVTVAPILTYAFACWAAGALVVRFGAKTAPKDATIAGGLSAILASAVTLLRASPAATLAAAVILLPIGFGLAWLGGRFGLRLRVASVHRLP
ncbi:MAG TPA: hypothetical protein VF881_17900 [Polyangiaceae bacterium]